MKTILYIINVLFISMIVASCSKEINEIETIHYQTTVEAIVNYTMEGDGSTAPTELKTRATLVNRYMIEVYQDASYTQAANIFADGTNKATNKEGSFLMTLEEGQSYYCLLWADASGESVYEVSSLKTVSLKQGMKPTEAFYGKLVISEVKPTYSMVLNRAVAKINLCDKIGLEENISIALKYNQSTEFSIVDGNASGSRTDDYTLISSEAFADEAFASFWMLASEEATTFDLAFQVEGEAGRVVSSITYKSNYRTNIKGEYIVNKFRIGDFYYSDNTYSSILNPEKNCIGVIFWVNIKNRTQGKIVSLDQGKGYWGKDNVNEDTYSLDDGESNTTTLIMARKNQSNFATTYHAFDWIYTIKNNKEVTGRWYLPAINELKSLRGKNDNKVMQKVNAALDNIPGAIKIDTEVTPDHWYWSSTESQQLAALGYRFDYGTTLYGRKAGNCSYRAISSFEIK